MTDREPLAGFFELQRQLARSLAPMHDLQKQIGAGLTNLSPGVVEFQSSIERIAQQSRPIVEAIGRQVAPFAKMMREIARIEQECRRFGEAGWLPHYTTPFQAIHEAHDGPEALASVVEAHYRGQWDEVHQQFATRLDRYTVDDEAKDTFRESLSAHGHGYYRATCRLLFPEIERTARIELHAGAINAKITSQRALRDIAGELAISEIEPRGYYGLRLYETLADHLYARVEDSAALAIVERDPVPNRHAALHGLVVYSTLQNSINTLIMTDYVFQVTSAVKRAQATAAA